MLGKQGCNFLLASVVGKVFDADSARFEARDRVLDGEARAESDNRTSEDDTLYSDLGISYTTLLVSESLFLLLTTLLLLLLTFFFFSPPPSLFLMLPCFLLSSKLFFLPFAFFFPSAGA